MGLIDRFSQRKILLNRNSVDPTDVFNVSKMRTFLKSEIKKQESDVNQPTFHLKDNKIHFLRPEGTSPLKTNSSDFIASKQKNSDKNNGLKKNNDLLKSESNSIKNSSTSPPVSTLSMADIRSAIEQELGSKPVQQKTVSISRVSTGVSGLDVVMSGGFRKNSVNLLAGGPGSGKTIFAMQFLIKGIEENNESGIFITFEQTEQEVLDDMESFGWDLPTKIAQKKLVILSYTPEQVEKVLRSGGGTVRDVIESISARRVVFDSLTAFTLLHLNPLSQRKACLDLFQAIKKWKCTALLLAEQEGNPELHSPTVEEFEVDGVLLLYNIRHGNVRERALEIFKMRGTKHSAKIFPMIIEQNGVVIYPDEEIF